MVNCIKIYEISEKVDEQELRGPNDLYIKAIESCLKIEVFCEEGAVYLKEEDMKFAKRVSNIVEAMELLIQNDITLSETVKFVQRNIGDDYHGTIISKVKTFEDFI